MRVMVLGLVLWVVLGCGDDDLSEADRLLVGAGCTSSEECDVSEVEQVCLPFKGGYCGVQGCASSDGCPQGSACVEHDEDGENYCFRTCQTKAECNLNRSLDSEANCSSSVKFVDEGTASGVKVCVPPTGS